MQVDQAKLTVAPLRRCMLSCRYGGRWEATRQAACRHALGSAGDGYVSELASAHALLGLVIAQRGSLLAYVSLTSPGSSLQIEIVGEIAMIAAGLWRELGRFFYDVLRSASAALGWDSVSSSCALPPLTETDHWLELQPGAILMCRLVGRGGYAELTSDISANELFMTPVVPIDLVEAAQRLRAAFVSPI